MVSFIYRYPDWGEWLKLINKHVATSHAELMKTFVPVFSQQRLGLFTENEIEKGIGKWILGLERTYGKPTTR